MGQQSACDTALLLRYIVVSFANVQAFIEFFLMRAERVLPQMRFGKIRYFFAELAEPVAPVWR